MPLLGGLLLLIQFSFAFHALRTGRPYWWMFVIMGFPVMGCVLYYFLEVFPSSRESRKADRAVRSIIKALDPDKGLRERAAELEVCGSIDNKIALARECMQHGMYEEAVKLYRSCLTGLHADDADLIFGLAHALLAGKLWQDALQAAERLRSEHPSFRANEVMMIRARTLESLGRFEEALALYATLAETFSGEEGRWRYGALLKQLGEAERARAVFQNMLKNANRMSREYRDTQKHWLTLARENIESSGA